LQSRCSDWHNLARAQRAEAPFALQFRNLNIDLPK
jgi:hypothetical protein